MRKKRPIVIDLYAGAGGLSLGAARAGFSVACAVELDPKALNTHAKNFPNTKHLQFDLSAVSSDEITTTANLKKEEITGIIGGPPCQGFSAIGLGLVDDTRNNLFIRFFEIVSCIKPAFYVAENVTGIMNEKYNEIRTKALQYVSSEYTNLAPFEIKASDYGAPTSRTRVFFIGFDPKRVKPISVNDFFSRKVKPKNAVHVKDALHGLPLNVIGCQNGLYVIDEHFFEDANPKTSSFYKSVIGHIPDGIGNPEALKEYKDKHIVTGCMSTMHSDAVKERYTNLSCGQQDKISKSTKLQPDGFCPTLRAGTGPEKGSYQAVRPIHYAMPRVITPREAARLQGFPDWFVFDTTIWHSFRQIGNSVSPIVAEKILSVILHKLT